MAVAGLAHPHGLSFLENACRTGRVEPVGFFDGEDPARAEAAADRFGVPCLDSFDALLQTGADVLLTAAVNSCKADYIVRALSAGLGVITDKPMAVTLEELAQIEAAAAATGAPLFLLLTERYSPPIYTARQWIGRGVIGEVVQQHLCRPHRLRPENRPDWMFHRAQYGGILNDLAVHDIDLACYFSGRAMRRVLAAHVSNARFPQLTDFCDNGIALFEMSHGGTASIEVNWLTPDAYRAHGDVQFFLTGTRGFLAISTVDASVRICTDTEPEHLLELIEPPCTCEEDALAKMADWSYPSLISTADSIAATRFALLAQLAAETV